MASFVQSSELRSPPLKPHNRSTHQAPAASVASASRLRRRRRRRPRHPLLLSPTRRMLAFTTIGGRAALCSPRRSSEWTFFPGDREYDDLVYSSTHNRLFCVTRGGVVLEGWDTSDESPRLDWAIQDKREPYFCGDMKECCQWPTQCMLKRQAGQVKYLVCDEQSGLFLVVRHVNLLARPHGAMVDTIAISQYGGRHYVKIPYKTFDFDVYKIEWERGEAIHMEDSLEGLAMFVGGNHSIVCNSGGGGAEGEAGFGVLHR